MTSMGESITLNAINRIRHTKYEYDIYLLHQISFKTGFLVNGKTGIKCWY